MSQSTTLSTTIDTQVKQAATQFCKKKGLKLRYFIEQALLESLEDEMDLEAYYARQNEETISLETILAKRKKN